VIENWIDALTAIWEVTAHGNKGLVYSFKVYKKDEFPESIDPAKFPVAISYPIQVSSEYSAGGMKIDYWTGITEFHLFPDVKKSNLPDILPYFARIRNAAGANMMLSGAVSQFMLRSAGGAASIQGPLTLQYGDEEPHHGLIVHWIVEEKVNTEFTAGDPSVT